MRLRIAIPLFALLAASLTFLGAGPQAEVIQSGHLRINFEGRITPHVLPRAKTVPVKVALGAKISATGGKTPPQLRQISIAINRHGVFDAAGLPLCSIAQIQPATTAEALHSCAGALVGEGHFAANVRFSEQAPYPSAGKLYAFNARYKGRPAILAHIYGKKPVPTSYTIPFLITESRHGTYGATLTATLPGANSGSSYVTGLQLNLGRTYSSHGQSRSYLSASCGTPKGIAVASFPLARASLAFAGKKHVSKTLTRSCKAR